MPCRARCGRDARRAIVEEALGEIGLAGYGERDPATCPVVGRARCRPCTGCCSGLRRLLDKVFLRLDSGLRGPDRAAGPRRRRAEHTRAPRHADADDARAAAGPVVVLAAGAGA
ncbi:MAG: hypothetical protein R3D02_04385 [Hyphomicrobiales bacterium]